MKTEAVFLWLGVRHCHCVSAETQDSEAERGMGKRYGGIKCRAWVL